MAHSQRGWTGARTPSAIKRVRQGLTRRAINQPRRSAAKTLVSKALLGASNGDAEQTREAVAAAVSALDRAAKIGAIHPNAAARRKSRLMLKVGAALGGEAVVGGGKVGRTTGKAAAVKEAKARIAASKATKAKGAQTAAGKARAALARSTRESTIGEGAAPKTEAKAEVKATKPTTKAATKATTARAATKATAKSTAKPTSPQAKAATASKAAAAAKSSTRAAATKASATTTKATAKSTAKPRSSKTTKSS